MKVFHYSEIDRLPEIVKGSWKSDKKPGLGASHRLGHHDDEAWRTSAVFALLDPTPKTWVQNPYFKDVWQYLISDVGDLLLEIETDPQVDNVFVLDRGYLEGYFYEDKTGIPDRYVQFSRKAAERAMMQSKIPLKYFLAREQELQYSLPEVIFPQNVPLDRIRISERQLRIDEKRERYGDLWYLDFTRRFQRAMESIFWTRNMEAVCATGIERR